MLTALALVLTLYLQAPCPLRVDGVREFGLALQIAIHNRADYGVRHVVLHVTFADPLNNYQERTYRYNILVQPTQDIVLTTPILNSLVKYGTTPAASATCRASTDEDDEGR